MDINKTIKFLVLYLLMALTNYVSYVLLTGDFMMNNAEKEYTWWIVFILFLIVMIFSKEDK